MTGMIDNEMLRQIYPHSTLANRSKYRPYIVEYAPVYAIDSCERISAFLAQVGHESGQLRYVEELASGKAYEGRADLGNVFEGDGVKYKGRGLIQITGRANYKKLSEDLKVDFVAYPELLCEPEYAVLSAFWYWNRNDLNRYATLRESDFKTLTRRINGGYNGYADRLAIWNRAKAVLGCEH